MTRPAHLKAPHQQHLQDLLTACSHLSLLAERITQFAELLTGRRGEDLDTWMAAVDADDLPPRTASSTACAATCPPSWPG